MNYIYAVVAGLLAGGLLCSTETAWAQGPAITTVAPAPNAHTSLPTSPLTVSFNQPLTLNSAAALKVYSARRGGLRTRAATPAQVSSNALSFIPTTYPFLPGETIHYTVTQAAASSGGTLAQPRVGQFTTAVGGTGNGNFVPGSDPAVGTSPITVTVGDVDGDGDLDLLTANFRGGASVRLNNGNGTFSGNQEVSVTGNIRSVTLGDVDGDGDLDLLAADYSDGQGTSVSVRLNNGAGLFSGSQSVAVAPGPYGVTLGDVDGNGDLDLLAASNNRSTGAVSVRLNDGAGTFSGSQDVGVGNNPHHVALGDVDGDGDLDLVTSNANSQNASVRFNNGNGIFGGGQNISVSGSPFDVVVGDVDGDGDLDLLTAILGGNVLVSVRLNNGAGVFGSGQDIPAGNLTGYTAFSLALGDVDGDGDLDLLATNANTGGPGTVLVRLNNGSGTFSGGQDVALGRLPQSVALGDVDGDGDLDLLAANSNDNTVSVRLNGGTTVPTLRLNGPATLCAGQAGVIIATGTPAPLSYLWSTGANTPSITVTQAGTYTVTATFANGQTASAQQVVQVLATLPAFTLGRDTTLCEGSELLLQGPAGAGFIYQWSDGSAGAALRVRAPGTYTLQVTSSCGTQAASRQVAFRSCPPVADTIIPNIITPNHDGLNDQFVIRTPKAGPWALDIYSRWGQHVYHSATYQNEWGTEAAVGLYYYLLRPADNGPTYKGWLEVVR